MNPGDKVWILGTVKSADSERVKVWVERPVPQFPLLVVVAPKNVKPDTPAE